MGYFQGPDRRRGCLVAWNGTRAEYFDVLASGTCSGRQSGQGIVSGHSNWIDEDAHAPGTGRDGGASTVAVDDTTARAPGLGRDLCLENPTQILDLLIQILTTFGFLPEKPTTFA